MRRDTSVPLGLSVIDKADSVKCEGTHGCSTPAQHRCTNPQCRRSLCGRHARRRDEQVCHRCHMRFAQPVVTPPPSIIPGADVDAEASDDEVTFVRHASGTIVFVANADVRYDHGQSSCRGIRLVQRIRARSEARSHERISVIVSNRRGLRRRRIKRSRGSFDSRQMALIS